MLDLRLLVRRLMMQLYLWTPYKRHFFRYPYNFTPAQLILLAQLAAEAAVAGPVFYEVGCAYGDTAIFLKKYLDERGLSVDYRVIDTFEGFLAPHLEHEIQKRGVTERIRYDFSVNQARWVRRRFAKNRVAITTIAQDACTVRFQDGPRIAFALLDVDLYLPIRDLLPKLYGHLEPGGILVVDDCDPSNPRWNGAHQAFMEFVEGQGLRYETALGKLGILRAPERTAQQEEQVADAQDGQDVGSHLDSPINVRG